MPKKSKVTSRGSRSNPGTAAPVKERPSRYWCSRCTRSYVRQKGNFPASQSPIFKENDGFLPVCKHCVDEMFDHYKAVLGDEKRAIYRICLKFDIYWNEKIYDMIYKASTTSSRVLAYISKSNLQQYAGKTFDDTLDEEEQDRVMRQLAGPIVIQSGDVDTSGEDLAYRQEEQEPFVITQEIVDFWGGGLDPAFYRELENRKKYWCGDNVDGMDIGELAVLKQICILEVTINRDSAAGKSIDRSVNSLNSLLGSANLKPVQKVEGNTEDTTPFGVWIRRIENTRPISDPDPEFCDVDGIRKYISVWFFGHLCKILKINNEYSRLYDEEMARLRVERPEYEGEDDEVINEDIFDRATQRELAEEAEERDRELAEEVDAYDAG